MATFPEYESYDALGLAALVEQGALSPEELLAAAMERAERWNPHINALNYPMFDEARATLRLGLPHGAFRGVPFLLKDLLADYAGVPLSSGSRFTQQWVPRKDSELVKRMKAAGLVVFGKTNVPEFGLSSVTEPVLFGPTRNPWNLEHAAGGSSGGSAAAVAAGIVPMAHGNDGGGSIRIPASYCGLFGLKPSRGRIPLGSEVMRMWESMVVEHVLTRSVRDSAAMLDVLSGPVVGASHALPKPDVSYLQRLEQPLAPLRMGFMAEPLFPAAVAVQQRDYLQRAVQLCQDLGHRVEPVTMQIDSIEVERAYVIVIAGEMAASIKRLGDLMGHKPRHADLERGTAVICHIGDYLSAADFAWAGDVLERAARQMAAFFESFDVLITPTMPSPPPLVGALSPDILEQGVLELLTHVPFATLLQKALDHAAARNFAYYPYTPIFNISGQPAMSVPLYWDAEGLPVGIQFASQIGEEAMLLQLARQLEEASPWFEKRPVLRTLPVSVES